MTVTKSYFSNSDNIPKLSKFAGTVSWNRELSN